MDDSATATVRALGDALTDIEVHGHTFGFCSLTVDLHGDDSRMVRHQSADVRKGLAARDGAFFEETCNLLDAWPSVMPGNGADNLRRLALLEIHAAGTNVRRSRISSSSRGQRRRWLAARPYCLSSWTPSGHSFGHSRADSAQPFLRNTQNP